jgi:hypothetical protein
VLTSDEVEACLLFSASKGEKGAEEKVKGRIVFRTIVDIAMEQ